MVRLIKRYESRKLYDTEESRYVSLDEIADWVRSDQEVRVIDNATSQDVTAQTLTQVILDEGRDGHSLPSELLHDLVRFGARALSSGVEQANGHDAGDARPQWGVAPGRRSPASLRLAAPRKTPRSPPVDRQPPASRRPQCRWGERGAILGITFGRRT